MEWWLWLVLGVLLLAIELFTPGGFYLLFFGIGAVATGVAALLPLPVGVALPAQIAIFLIVSLAGLVLFRNALAARFSRRGRARDVDSLSQSEAVVLADIAPGAIGKVELRGANWSARNTGPYTLARGQRCLVERVDGLTLSVRFAANDYLPVSGKEPVS